MGCNTDGCHSLAGVTCIPNVVNAAQQPIVVSSPVPNADTCKLEQVIRMAMVRQLRQQAMRMHHLASGVCGCDSRALDAVRRTGLLPPTLLPAASTCAGGRVSFSLRRSRARSALQLQDDTMHIRLNSLPSRSQPLHAQRGAHASRCRVRWAWEEIPPAAVGLQAIHIVPVHLEAGRLPGDATLTARLERWRPAGGPTLYTSTSAVRNCNGLHIVLTCLRGLAGAAAHESLRDARRAYLL